MTATLAQAITDKVNHAAAMIADGVLVCGRAYLDAWESFKRSTTMGPKSRQRVWEQSKAIIGDATHDEDCRCEG